MTDPIELTPEELLRFQEIMKAWHKVWDEGTTDQPLLDIVEEDEE